MTFLISVLKKWRTAGQGKGFQFYIMNKKGAVQVINDRTKHATNVRRVYR